MKEKIFFSPEQLAKARKIMEKLDPETVKHLFTEWPKIIAKIRSEMNKGTPADDPEVQKLIKPLKELMYQYSGGDPQAAQTLKRWIDELPDTAAAHFGIEPQIIEYIKSAVF